MRGSVRGGRVGRVVVEGDLGIFLVQQGTLTNFLSASLSSLLVLPKAHSSAQHVRSRLPVMLVAFVLLHYHELHRDMFSVGSSIGMTIVIRY